MNRKKFTTGLLGGAALALLASVGSASAAVVNFGAGQPTGSVLVFDRTVGVGATNATTFDTLGINGTANTFIGSASGSAGGYSYSFAGGSPDPSGIYAGNISDAASPFGNTNSTERYFSADGGGGMVTLTLGADRTSLLMLWGTVDLEPLRNVVTFFDGTNQVFSMNGSTFNAACGTCITNAGNQEALLFLNNIPNFDKIVFSDGPGNAPAFEFAVAAVPELSTWGMMIVGFFGLGFFGYRKSKASGSAFRMA